MGNLLDDIVSRVVCDTDHKSCKFRIGCRPGQLVYLSQQEIESMQQDFMADNAGWSLFWLFYGQTSMSFEMYPQKIDDSHFYWEYTMSYALKTIETLNSPCDVL